MLGEMLGRARQKIHKRFDFYIIQTSRETQADAFIS